MASYDIGMQETCEWIRENLNKGDTALDVGACDGKWAHWLDDYLVMDAVEIFEPYIRYNHLKDKYRAVFNSDVADFKYDHYDLVIFGDVLEHMPVEKAQAVVEYAKEHAKYIVIAVPFLYPQEPYDGNEYERHIQDDIDEKIFDQRYPGFEMIIQPAWNYAYYHSI